MQTAADCLRSLCPFQKCASRVCLCLCDHCRPFNMIQLAIQQASRRCLHSGAIPTHMRHAWQMLQQSSLQVIQACSGTQSSTLMLSYRLSVPKSRLLLQVPNAGRGLAPVETIQQGTVIHSEKPMLCFPALKHLAKVWPSSSSFWTALA